MRWQAVLRSMLRHSVPAYGRAADLSEELGRARRVVLALSNPRDLHIIERYIAELEALQILADTTSIPAMLSRCSDEGRGYDLSVHHLR